MSLNARSIKGFVEALLLPTFDDPSAVPSFHQEVWEMFSTKDRKVAIAAPRGHAKTSALTLCFGLATVLFREASYVVIISSNEAMASEFLKNIAGQLKDNQELIQMFGIKVIKDNETEIVGVAGDDDRKFRILAKGAGQKLRGLLWRGKRPDLILCDDMEDDEQVMNDDRRRNFKKWFMGAVIPLLSRSGRIRVHGTILHADALLENILSDSTWKTKRYQAHNEDFSEILWPERFTRSHFEEIRESYINQGYPEGYSQEYLNQPIDEATAYFRRNDILPIRDKSEKLTYYAAIDPAISEADSACYTAIVVCGVSSSNKLKVVDVRRFRGDASVIVEEVLSVNARYNPDLFIFESGAIEKALGPYLYEQMRLTGEYVNVYKVTPTKDKQSRARPIQARMRAGGVEIDTDADWFPALQGELLTFPRGKYKDQVDALSWVGLVLPMLQRASTKEEIEEEEEYESTLSSGDRRMGISAICGY